MPSFGSILACLALGVRFLDKISKSLTAVDEIKMNKCDVMFLIDQSIQLILSQSSLLLRYQKYFYWSFTVLTVCNIFAPIFPICITCYPPMRTINFGKYLRLFQIEPIKTMEFRLNQIWKIGAKMLHTVVVEITLLDVLFWAEMKIPQFFWTFLEFWDIILNFKRAIF